MPEFEDLDIKLPSDEPGEGRSVGPMVAVAVIVIALIGIAIYWFAGGGEIEEQAAAPRPTPAAVPPPPRTVTPPEPVDDPEPVELPLLNESDALVRDLVSSLSAHPELAAWLVNEGLIRRFVVMVDNVANGTNPTQHVPFMKPDRRFAVTGNNPSMHVDPDSYRRYDMHAQIVSSLSAAGTSELYLTLEPLMDEAYRELGYPDTPFRRALERAINHLLEVPIVDSPPTVVRGAAFFEYTDERLDELSPAQKQLLGMGPDNLRTVHAKMRSLAAAIGLNVR